MKIKIPPKVGSAVVYRDEMLHGELRMATVEIVNEDSTVDLAPFMPGGTKNVIARVLVLHPGEERPEESNFCEPISPGSFNCMMYWVLEEFSTWIETPLTARERKEKS